MQQRGDKFFQNRGKVNNNNSGNLKEEKELSFKERLDFKKNGFSKPPTEEELEEHLMQKRNERYQKNSKQKNEEQEQEQDDEEEEEIRSNDGKRPKSA